MAIITFLHQQAVWLQVGKPYCDQKIFTASSVGTGGITISNIIYPSGFTGITKITGNTIEVTVTFKPTDVIDYGGNISIESDATSGNSTLPVKGKGVKITASQDQAMKGIEVYPNPTKDILYVRAVVPINSVEIVDSQGRSWNEIPQRLGANTSQLDMSGYAAGSYYLKIKTESGNVMKQIVKN